MPAPAPKLVTNSDPSAVVECRVCGNSKEARSMPGHVGSAHSLKVQEYVDKYGLDSGRDFYFSGAPDQKKKLRTIEDEALAGLSATERDFYDNYSQEIFGQIDRDMAQWPIVMALTIDMIHLNRARIQMDQINNPKGDKKLPDAKTIDALVRNQKYAAERVAAQMDALGISRDRKLKNKAQIKTTPFSLLAGYMDELERMKPEQLQSMENEERKLYSIVKDRIARLYLSVAPDIKEEPEEENGSLSNLDVFGLLERFDSEV